MKRKWLAYTVAALCVVAIIGAVIGLLAQVPGPQPQTPVQKPPSAVTSAPNPVAKAVATTSKPKKDPRAAEAKRWQGQLAAQFQRVADIYAQTSKYPPYSLPIDKKDLAQYHYNRYFPITVPLQSDGGKIVLKIELKQLHFQKGDTITGQVSVSGKSAQDVEMSDVAIISHKDKVLYTDNLGQPSGKNSYKLSIKPSETDAKDWPSQLMVRVSGTWGSHKVAAVAPFYYDDPIGKVTDVGDAYIDGANLVIPVTADLNSSGYYAISGNLYSTSGQPLVHLEAQTQMSQFNNTAKLRVHRVALQAKGDAGPYLLKDLMLRKLPDKPGDRTLFGPTDKKSFQVQGFPFSDYSQDPYVDPMRQARLKFFREAQPGGS